jgi:hypothetical protein
MDYSDHHVIATEEPGVLGSAVGAPSGSRDDLLCALASRSEVRVWAGKAFGPINPPMSLRWGSFLCPQTMLVPVTKKPGTRPGLILVSTAPTSGGISLIGPRRPPARDTISVRYRSRCTRVTPSGSIKASTVSRNPFSYTK